MRFSRPVLYVLGVSLLFFLLGFLRRPEIFLHPQFWAEDGRVWFADAHNIGVIRSLWLVQDGYFQTLARLVASAAQLFPVWIGPLLFNAAALVVNTLPAVFVVSSRFQKLLPSFQARLVLGLAIILLPNTAEVHGNLTNAQWYLALLALFVFLADSPLTWFGKLFDYLVMFLTSLSGPFIFLLLPLALFQYVRGRLDRHRLFLLLITVTGCIIQGGALLFISSIVRTHSFLDFPIIDAFSVFSRQVVLGATLGSGGYAWLVTFGFTGSTLLIGIAATIVILYALLKAPSPLKLAIVFAVLVFAVSLISPTLPKGEVSAATVLFNSTSGVRYWLIPMTVFIMVLGWSILKAQARIIRVLSVFFAIAFMCGVYADFRYPTLPDVNFSEHAWHYNSYPEGSYQILPINPHTWWMAIKR